MNMSAYVCMCVCFCICMNCGYSHYKQQTTAIFFSFSGHSHTHTQNSDESVLYPLGFSIKWLTCVLHLKRVLQTYSMLVTIFFYVLSLFRTVSQIFVSQTVCRNALKLFDESEMNKKKNNQKLENLWNLFEIVNFIKISFTLTHIVLIYDINLILKVPKNQLKNT